MNAIENVDPKSTISLPRSKNQGTKHQCKEKLKSGWSLYSNGVESHEGILVIWKGLEKFYKMDCLFVEGEQNLKAYIIV